MFTKPLSYIITEKNLLDAYERVSKTSSGLDEVSFRDFEKDLSSNIKSIKERILTGLYSPEPIKKIAIDKADSKEKLWKLYYVEKRVAQG
jgi:retron-type reverse transcriptase